MVSEDTIKKLQKYTLKLKKDIKDWEHSFQDEHKRIPTQVDIKANEDVAYKYKSYQKYKRKLEDALKEGVSETKENRDLFSGTGEKHKHNNIIEKDKYHRQHHHHHHHHHHHPHDQDPNEEKSKITDNSKAKSSKKDQVKKIHKQDSNKVFIESVNSDDEDLGDTKNGDEANDLSDLPDDLGPTPQLQGRVMGIFDINVSTTPDKKKIIMRTPTKLKKEESITPKKLKISPSNVKNPGSSFKTPTTSRVERKLLFTDLVTPTSRTDENTVSRNIQQSLQNTIITPRRKELPSSISETPLYLRQQSESHLQVELEAMKSNQYSPDSSSSDTSISPIKNTVKFMSQPAIKSELMTTPIKTKSYDDSLIMSMSPSRLSEPSPFFKKVRSKSIFELQNDLIKMNNEQENWMNYEDEEIRKLIELEKKTNTDSRNPEKIPTENNDNNNEITEKQILQDEESIKLTVDVEEDINSELVKVNVDEAKSKLLEKLRKKSKTQKRTTRRVKMKTQALDENDTLKDMDVHQHIEELIQENLDELNESDTEIDDLKSNLRTGTEGDEVFDKYFAERKRKLEDEANNLRKSKKVTGAHPLSNNFVRLNINRHSNFKKKFNRR
ncbi:hypothetical protein B5S29_g2431 [[Candida] boidinii]|nr:hypothetical protein B5S29_g2431 [[Candida] boidinii]